MLYTGVRPSHLGPHLDWSFTEHRVQMTLVVSKAFVFEKYLQNIQRFRITHLV